MKTGTRILIVLVSLFFSALAGTILMWLAYMLPSARIEEHVKTSALVFQKEGTYPVLTEYASSQLDNWTDALMLNEASCTAAEKGKALITAMENPYGVIGKETPAEVLADHFLNGTPYERLKPYPRYWQNVFSSPPVSTFI